MTARLTHPAASNTKVPGSGTAEMLPGGPSDEPKLAGLTALNRRHWTGKSRNHRSYLPADTRRVAQIDARSRTDRQRRAAGKCRAAVDNQEAAQHAGSARVRVRAGKHQRPRACLSQSHPTGSAAVVGERGADRERLAGKLLNEQFPRLIRQARGNRRPYDWCRWLRWLRRCCR